MAIDDLRSDDLNDDARNEGAADLADLDLSDFEEVGSNDSTPPTGSGEAETEAFSPDAGESPLDEDPLADPLASDEADLDLAAALDEVSDRPAPESVESPVSAEPETAEAEVAETVAEIEGAPADATADPEEVGEELDEAAEPRQITGFTFGDIFKGVGAVGASALIHVVALVALGVLVFDDVIKAEVQTLVASTYEDEERPEDEPVEIELSEEIEVVTEQTLAVISSAPAVGAAGPEAAMGSPTLDQRLVEQAEATEVFIDAPTLGIPDAVGLIESVPDGEVKGEPRDLVDNYQQAMDRLAQELIWMLDKGPVLAVWLFDQSQSMKDDQREIRDRFANVYNQLGIVGEKNSNALLTSVSSYGNGFLTHTRQPTSNREMIRKAIDEIPVDKTGDEMMCQAIGAAITKHARFAGRTRKMALIVVTDESGDPKNNGQYLERAIAAAKKTKCKIYVLGREAMFGYRFAYLRWRHPQTERVHWLPMERGPETAFPEQLQTNGLRRRHDAFSSGFGPYEQARLARETNGIFFMLPSIEEDLVGKENKMKYDLEAMRPFLPDMRAQVEVFADRAKFPLRTILWKVISDLDPFNEQAKKVVELDHAFPLQLQECVAKIRENQTKAKLLLRYLAEVQKVLEEGKLHRDQEANPRWQANYDLIYSQVIAYQARIYEYGVGLDAFLKNWQEEVKKNPLRKGELTLHDWHVGYRKQLLTEESKPYVEKANSLLADVREAYPGTPWAARAQYELSRGYGVYLHPRYDRPYKQVEKPTPIPKL